MRSASAAINFRTQLLGSWALGGVTWLGPIVSYGVVVPAILGQFSFELLGLWSLIATIPAVVSLADIGIGLALERDVGAMSEGAIRDSRRQIAALRWLYVVFAGMCGVLVSLLASIGLTAILLTHISDEVLYAAVLAVLGGLLQLSARFNLAILTGLLDAAYARAVLGTHYFILGALALAGVLLSRPLIGLGVAIVIAAGFTHVASRRRLRRRHREWSSSLRADKLTTANFSLAIGAAWRSGRPFLAVTSGFMLREAVARLSVAALGGLSGLGVFDIGFRVAKAVREALGSGLNVLLAVYGALTRLGPSHVVPVTADLTAALAAIAGIAVGGFGLFGKQLLSWWLGPLGADLMVPTLLVIIWAVVTLIFAPFWFYLQASGFEHVAAKIIWLHVLVVASPLVYAHYLKSLSSVALAAAWLVTGLAIQPLIVLGTPLQRKLAADVARRIQVWIGAIAGVALAFMGIVFRFVLEPEGNAALAYMVGWTGSSVVVLYLALRRVSRRLATL